MRNVFIFLLLFFGGAVAAQETTPTAPYQIETQDGSIFIGIIVERTATHLTLHTQSAGELDIAFADILTIIPAKRLIAKNLPQNTRYLFGQNAYSLKRRENYYQNAWLFVNHFSYGVTDYFTLGGGLMPVFLVGESTIPVWISPKLSIPVIQDKINVGVGSLNGTLLGWKNSGFGLLYGHATIGSQHTNFSVGVGRAYIDGQWAHTGAFSVSGLLKIGKRAYVMTENYLVENGGLYSLGGRQMINRLSIDYGLMVVSETFDLITIPWLGISVPFYTPKTERK